MKYYECFGLTIESDVPLPPLMVCKDCKTPNVIIVRGYVSEYGIESPVWATKYSQANVNTLWFDVPFIGRFLVKNGNEVTVCPIDGIDEETICTFIIESCLSAICLQRGSLVYTGSSVLVGNMGIMLLGEGGIGKATLTAALRQKGCSVLTDNIVVLDHGGKVLAGFPSLKLWYDSMVLLDIDSSECMRVRPQIRKFYWPLGSLFCQHATAVNTIYLLTSHNLDSYHFEELKGVGKFKCLAKYRFRSHLSEIFTEKKNAFNECVQFVSKCRVIEITQPKTGNVDMCVELILRDIQVQGALF